MGLTKRLQERSSSGHPDLDTRIQVTSVPKKGAPLSVVTKGPDRRHDYQELKEKIHRRLIDQLDLAKLESIPKEKLAVQECH
jgi:carbamoylphosphate synthase small subunit